jgi:DNA-binding response OmpR family regulator
VTVANSRKVLIVDDEFSIVETLAEILSFEGFEVASAANGTQALSMVVDNPPGLILLDYMMPVMDGLEFLAKLRQQSDTAQVPVIMMTAAPLNVPPKNRQWNALLRKPFDLQTLLETIENVRSASNGQRNGSR